MYFISSLSSVHKFSIYFHPGLSHSSTCKAPEVAFFFPTSAFLLLTNAACWFQLSYHKTLFQGTRFVFTLLLQIFGDTSFPAAEFTASSYSLLPVVGYGPASLSSPHHPQGVGLAHAHPLLLNKLAAGAVPRGKAGSRAQKVASRRPQEACGVFPQRNSITHQHPSIIKLP